MAFSFITNIANRFKRKNRQNQFAKKTRQEHEKARRNERGDKYASKEKIGLLWFLPKVNFKLIIIPVIFLILACLGYYAYTLVQAWLAFTPREYGGATASSAGSANTWRADTKLSILMVGIDRTDAEHVFVDALVVYTIDPFAGELTVFSVNPDLKVFVSSLGREVNFRTAFNDKNLTGDKLTVLKNSVSALLAIKVDKYMLLEKHDAELLFKEFNPVKADVPKDVADPDLKTLPEKTVVTWKKGEGQLISAQDFLEFVAADANGRDDQLTRQQNLFSAIPYSQNSIRNFLNLPKIIEAVNKYVSTDLKKDEMLTVLYKASQTKQDSVKKGFTRDASYSKVQAISFYPVYSPKLDSIDKDINNIFFDLSIFKEQAKIEILNASSVRGLANSRARWITNLGARIIKIGNSYASQEKTRIYCPNAEKYPETITELMRIFNNKAELVNEVYPNRHVGDIVIELGNEFE